MTEKFKPEEGNPKDRISEVQENLDAEREAMETGDKEKQKPEVSRGVSVERVEEFIKESLRKAEGATDREMRKLGMSKLLDKK